MRICPTLIAAAAAALTTPAFSQTFNCTVTGASSMSANFTGGATFTGTFTGNYDQVNNPTGTRVLNWNIFGTRPGPPTNLVKNMHGSGSSSGTANGNPVGNYALAVDLAAHTVTLSQLNSNLVGPATPNTSPVNATVSYDSFLTASPNYSYPFLIPISLPLGNASLTALQVTQTAAAAGPLTSGSGGAYTFSLTVPADVVVTLDFQGSSITNTSAQSLSVTGSVTPGATTCAASLTISLNQSDNNNTPQPQPPTPFDMPDPGGSANPAHLILTLTITSQSDTVNGSATLPASGVLVPPPPTCGSADFDCDGDTGTDADIQAFFRCLAGSCPGTPCPSDADFNGDGDSGTDADIESFFRVLAGGNC
jgi:hypothetical protein